MLWDLSTDYYLHHADPKNFATNVRRTYARWYTPENLETRALPPVLAPDIDHNRELLSKVDEYWLEYYRPITISSFVKILSYKMSSKLHHGPSKLIHEGVYDPSPFKVRAVNEPENIERDHTPRARVIGDPKLTKVTDEKSPESSNSSAARQTNLPKWLQGHLHQQSRSHSHVSKVSDPRAGVYPLLENRMKSTEKPLEDKSAATQMSLSQFVDRSLNPLVSEGEAHEYQRYIHHPLNISLLALQHPSSNISSDFSRYIEGSKLQLETETPRDGETAEYAAFLDNGDDPLTVTEADIAKKRYKAYRQWLKGKSLFKQQRVEA